MANHLLKKQWRNCDNSDFTNSFSGDIEMKISSWYSKQNYTQSTSLPCSAGSPEDLRWPFKYFSFAKQAIPPKEIKGNLNDLGLIFL